MKLALLTVLVGSAAAFAPASQGGMFPPICAPRKYYSSIIHSISAPDLMDARNVDVFKAKYVCKMFFWKFGHLPVPKIYALV